MKIILSKDDLEEIIKKLFDIEAVGWNDDGTLTIDTVLEKLVNDKSKFNTDDLRRMLGRHIPTPYISPPLTPNPYIQTRPVWYSSPGGQTTIMNPMPLQQNGFVNSVPLKPKEKDKNE